MHHWSVHHRCTYTFFVCDFEPLRTKPAHLRPFVPLSLSPRKGTKCVRNQKKRQKRYEKDTKKKKHTTHPAPASPAEHEPTGRQLLNDIPIVTLSHSTSCVIKRKYRVREWWASSQIAPLSLSLYLSISLSRCLFLSLSSYFSLYFFSFSPRDKAASFSFL